MVGWPGSVDDAELRPLIGQQFLLFVVAELEFWITQHADQLGHGGRLIFFA
jgi:hypothetical protein